MLSADQLHNAHFPVPRLVAEDGQPSLARPYPLIQLVAAMCVTRLSASHLAEGRDRDPFKLSNTLPLTKDLLSKQKANVDRLRELVNRAKSRGQLRNPDKIVAFEQIGERGDADLWTLPLNGPRQAGGAAHGLGFQRTRPAVLT